MTNHYLNIACKKWGGSKKKRIKISTLTFKFWKNTYFLTHNNTKMPTFFIEPLVFFLILSADTIRMSADSLIAFKNILIVFLDSLIGRAIQQNESAVRLISNWISKDSQSYKIRNCLTICRKTIGKTARLISEKNAGNNSFIPTFSPLIPFITQGRKLLAPLY